MAKKRISRPRLAPAAGEDLRKVLGWSAQNFGESAAKRYGALIKQAIRDIGESPGRPGPKERPEIMVRGARTYHISLSRVSGPGVKEPRHFLLYRRRADGVIEVAAFFTTAETSNATFLKTTARATRRLDRRQDPAGISAG